MRPPRMTMGRTMVVVGMIAVWLWLLRTNACLTASGSLVLALMLHAIHRRGILSGEIRATGGRMTPLSVAGLAGYALAILLALAWVISIVVWDSYEHGER